MVYNEDQQKQFSVREAWEQMSGNYEKRVLIGSMAILDLCGYISMGHLFNIT